MTDDERTARVQYKLMVRSCYVPSSNSYKGVGERGIGMCKRWRAKFETFLEDMGTPGRGQQLHRIRDSEPFSKDNCYWG